MILVLDVPALGERLSVLLNASALVLQCLTLAAQRCLFWVSSRAAEALQKKAKSSDSTKKYLVNISLTQRLQYEGNNLPNDNSSLIEFDIVDGVTISVLLNGLSSTVPELSNPQVNEIHSTPALTAVPIPGPEPVDNLGDVILSDFSDVSLNMNFVEHDSSQASSGEIDFVEPDEPQEQSQGSAEPQIRPEISDFPTGKFDLAIQKLELSAIPQNLPCREAERTEIRGFLDLQLEPKGHGHIFLTGIPGTGKTATVREVIAGLKTKISALGARYIELNAMAFTQPAKFFEFFAKELSPKGSKSLRSTSSYVRSIETWMQKSKVPCILLLDEIDRLVTGRASDEVMYDLLNWTTSHLILIGISNTMDLAERLQARIVSRFGCRIVEFKAYTRAQLSEIISNRISYLGLFDNEAIDFASRNIVRISGDARRALEICRSAVMLAREQQLRGGASEERVSVDHIAQILEQAGSSVTVKALQMLPLYHRLMLCATVRLRHISPDAQITHRLLLDRFDDWMRLYRLPQIDRFRADEILVALQTCWFLKVTPESLDSKIELVIQEDDISAAYVGHPTFNMEYLWLSGHKIS